MRAWILFRVFRRRLQNEAFLEEPKTWVFYPCYSLEVFRGFLTLDYWWLLLITVGISLALSLREKIGYGPAPRPFAFVKTPSAALSPIKWVRFNTLGSWGSFLCTHLARFQSEARTGGMNWGPCNRDVRFSFLWQPLHWGPWCNRLCGSHDTPGLRHHTIASASCRGGHWHQVLCVQCHWYHGLCGS